MIKKKIAIKRAATLGNMRNNWEKQKQENAFSPCLQETRMRRATREDQKTDV